MRINFNNLDGSLNKMELKKNGFDFIYKYLIEPITLIIGVNLNIFLYIIIYRKKRTKNLQSTKPLRYLLMTILLSDTWFLIDKFNIWYFSIMKKNNLTSVNFLCQFISYLNYFVPIILEFSMLAADYILVSLVFKSTQSKDVYNNFLPTTEERLQKHSSLSHSKKTKQNLFNSLKNTKNTKNVYRYYSRRSISLESNLESLDNLEKIHFVKDTRKPKHKPFVHLIESVCFKREEVYNGIILREKCFLILNTFIWMYLLSFIFWINGLTKLDTRNLITKTNFTNSDTLGDICSTHVYYQRLALLLNIFLSILKIFTILCNLISSLMFHIKFRSEYFQSIKSNLKKNNFELKPSSKLIKFKKFNFLYATKTNVLDKESSNRSTSYTSHYKHLHFVRHYALVALIYSMLISPSIFYEYKNNLKTIFSNLSTQKNERYGFGEDLLFLIPNNESNALSFIDKFIQDNHDIPEANEDYFKFSNYSE
ncbi:unnamed protein product, partial [Brachionus calyciflorus]